MSLGDRLAFVGLIVAFAGVGITILWATKRWIGWACIFVAVIVCIVWGVLEYRTHPEIVTQKVLPTITWGAPTPIDYGTPLSNKQLNATASVNGKRVEGQFVYNPTLGATPPVGTDTLSATFTPNDAGKYFPQSKTVAIVVRPLPAANKEDPFASGLSISANIGPGMYSDGTNVYGIVWKDYYTEVELDFKNVLKAPLDNIDMAIQTDARIANVKQITDNPCIQVEEPKVRAWHGYSNTAKHFVDIIPLGLTLSYQVSCNQLLADRVIRLMVAVADPEDLLGGTPIKHDPDFVAINGYYETGLVDGHKRYPIKWTHQFVTHKPSESRQEELETLKAFYNSGADLLLSSTPQRRQRYRAWAQVVAEYLDKEFDHATYVRFKAQLGDPSDSPSVNNAHDVIWLCARGKRYALDQMIRRLQNQH
jgi:hypothetical protein